MINARRQPPLQTHIGVEGAKRENVGYATVSSIYAGRKPANCSQYLANNEFYAQYYLMVVSLLSHSTNKRINVSELGHFQKTAEDCCSAHQPFFLRYTASSSSLPSLSFVETSASLSRVKLYQVEVKNFSKTCVTRTTRFSTVYSNVKHLQKSDPVEVFFRKKTCSRRISAELIAVTVLFCAFFAACSSYVDIKLYTFSMITENVGRYVINTVEV